MDEKLGVFLCTGYGIAEAVDLDELEALARDDLKADHVSRVPTCEGADLDTIREEILREGLTKVLVAGISPRRFTHGAFPDGVIVEPVAFREHVVWTQPAGEEDTQMLAADLLRMYVAKLRKANPVEPFELPEPVEKSVLVVGGGITGMSAALGAARAGYPVHLVEQSERLGGWLGRQHLSVPTRPPYRALEETGVDDLAAEIADDPRVSVHTSARTGAIAGSPGFYDVTLTSAGNGKPEGEVLETFRVGAIVQATGWTPTDPRPDLPWGGLPDVVRNVEMEELVRAGGEIRRPSDGRPVKSVAFIQCGGFREKEKHSYCSSICCLTALKQALYLRERDDSAKAFIFYEFLRTPGHYEDFYRRVQEDPGVFPTRGEVADVVRDDDGSLTITVRNTMPGEEIRVKVDLVVLAAGMKPNSADGEAIRALEGAKVTAEKGESADQRKEAARVAAELSPHEGTEILNLDYRLGPDLPTLAWGFPDSHFICFPFETRRTGIYAAGGVRQPMDGVAAREDGAGAALKAIQCLEMTSRGEAVHPRSGDQSWPDFFLQRCTQCKRCTEECPFGVLNEDEKGTPHPSPTRCRRCGVCMGACPERIVSFRDYSVDMVASMIKAVEVPDEYEEKPRVLALLCENDAMPALDLAAQHRLQIPPFVRIVPVRCLGSVNSVWVTEAISAGYDGVILIGCKYGDDYQCHFVKGSELAVARGKNIREKLEQMAMENERVEIHELEISEYERLPQIFADFAEVIEQYGMNPFKGM